MPRRLSVPALSSGAAMRQAQRQFVADHLRRTAQAAQQTVLVVRRPSGQRDSIDAHRTDGENEQNTDIDIRQFHHRLVGSVSDAADRKAGMVRLVPKGMIEMEISAMNTARNGASR